MSATACTCDTAHVTHVRTSALSIFGEGEAWLAARPGHTYLVGHGWHFDNEEDAHAYAFGDDAAESRVPVSWTATSALSILGDGPSVPATSGASAMSTSPEAPLAQPSPTAPIVDPDLVIPAATLNDLEERAAAVEHQEWEVWDNSHQDPVVVPAGGTPWNAITDPDMPFERVTGLSTGPKDYGRSNLQHIAGMDPATTRKMIAYVRALENALDTKEPATSGDRP